MLRIPCKDLQTSEDFYTDKLGLTKVFGSHEEGFIGYQLDNSQLMLENEETGEFECGRFLGFSLQVEDIQAYYSAAQDRGVAFTGAPEKQFWGGMMTHVIDCNGNSFSIVQ
ncbi:hypothetical protein R50073_21270 [Maricurvus nonylphenolicus]|uniref:VOC family protein n=1 Tax=Maricurvus nonylphenolicus TaxID=1008307 RepID=UPI0036F3E871